ncbi:MAG TPA: hypothetical protein VH062_02360 [Polyangiaceae bacterium]|jgi:hypothetical protein|nr:hypothetical protein [Polyangiaceae bacterium]
MNHPGGWRATLEFLDADGAVVGSMRLRERGCDSSCSKDLVIPAGLKWPKGAVQGRIVDDIFGHFHHIEVIPWRTGAADG